MKYATMSSIMQLSHEQRRIILDTVKERGVMAMAAHLAGITLSRLRAIINTDEAFKADVEDAQAEHADAIYLTALERATSGKSDALLSKIMEAKIPGFSKESREPISQKGKPTGLRLRTFDTDGNETGVTDIATKPLQIEMYKGI